MMRRTGSAGLELAWPADPDDQAITGAVVGKADLNEAERTTRVLTAKSVRCACNRYRGRERKRENKRERARDVIISEHAQPVKQQVSAEFGACSASRLTFSDSICSPFDTIFLVFLIRTAIWNKNACFGSCPEWKMSSARHRTGNESLKARVFAVGFAGDWRLQFWYRQTEGEWRLVSPSTALAKCQDEPEQPCFGAGVDRNCNSSMATITVWSNCCTWAATQIHRICVVTSRIISNNYKVTARILQFATKSKMSWNKEMLLLKK